VKVGDLVKFSSPTAFKTSESRYAASGIVVGLSDREAQPHPKKRIYEVLWADGKHTKEWDCYLEALNESR